MPTTKQVSAETALAEALSKVRLPDDPSLIIYIPPEILEEIFLICAGLPLTRGERPNRLAISQVCQQWRLITLNNPWIWGRIEVGHPQMAKELLSRSAGAYLDIVCAPDARIVKIRGTDLQPYTRQIRSFDITFKREYELGNLFSKIGDDFPNLAIMSLNHIDYLYRSKNNPIKSKAPYSPRIDRLELRSVSVDWIPKITDMTFLELRGVDDQTPNIQLLHSILKSSPRLEHLSLDSIPIYNTDISALANVALPRLRILYIEERESVILSLLSLLSIPTSARIILDFRSADVFLDDLENTRVVIQDDNIKLLRPAEWNSYSSSPGSARLKVEEGQSLSSFLSGLSSAFDLGRFTTLEINKAILSFLPTPFLVGFFNHFSVRVLCIGPNDLEPSHYRPPQAIAPRRYVAAASTSTSPGGEDAALDPDGSKSIVALALARFQSSKGPLHLHIHIPIPAGVMENLKMIVSQVSISVDSQI